MTLRHLRVLLVSPLPGVDPFNGDVVYSQALLEQPPPGVTYVRYDDALASGELIEHGRRRSLPAGPINRARAAALSRLVREHAVNRVRRHGVLFREPFRLLEIRGHFDLVHCHTYSVQWTGVPTPVLVSNALPLSELYAVARGWRDGHVRFADEADRLLARMLGVSHIAHGQTNADRVVAFTHALARWYVERGVPIQRLGVVPCFPAGMPSSVEQRPVPGRIGFVAGDFLSKGGDTVLRAMGEIRRRRPDAHVWVAGGPTGHSPSELAAMGVTWRGYLRREELLTRFLPSCQVFAYPTRFDGLPLTLLEALGSGVPAVVSDYFGLPEVVSDGESGRVVPQSNPAALADAVVELLGPEVNRAASTAARLRYESTYSPARVRPLLRENYDSAIGDGGPGGRAATEHESEACSLRGAL
jgi:glycosyltransferase involved in cell wall biosynthesis